MNVVLQYIGQDQNMCVVAWLENGGQNIFYLHVHVHFVIDLPISIIVDLPDSVIVCKTMLYM
jgi:hypothetical protein